ncbi:hypothetical protein LTR64_002214 [Lithohypha guttulata]|uniref:uncharacterized protein n=1 Tax=Lithohypha guttulata TaxID=1690604 RepID=UPI002DE07E3B|nr:hypothetical protein LTR51_001560 [Lithohypha guttulata]
MDSFMITISALLAMKAYQPRIAVIGGGPGGLTLALLLHKHNIPVTVFELRPRPTETEFTQPAGMLDLHEESGLAAIRACDLMEEFNSHTGVCSEAQIIATKDGKVIYSEDGGPESRPEISRNSLGKILYDRLPEAAVRWGFKLSSAKQVTATDGGTEIELDFGSKGEYTFDFVVGSDGTWSKVRKMLTDTKPTYSGIQLMNLTIRGITSKYPELAAYIGTGTFTCLGQQHGVMSQRGLHDSARLYLCFKKADEQYSATAGIRGAPPAQARDRLLHDDALLGRFGPKIKELVQVAYAEEAEHSPDAEPAIVPLYVLPPGHRWEHQTGVTVIGDAAHVMLPFAAEGVNLAMRDALDVADVIIKATETAKGDRARFHRLLDLSIEGYEVQMAERAKEKADEADQNARMMFGFEDGATAMADWMNAAMQAAMEQAEPPKIMME